MNPETSTASRSRTRSPRSSTAVTAPKLIATTLLSIKNAGYGESAYAWLLGDPVPDPDAMTALGLARPLRPATDVSPDAASNVSAVDALEVVAALHKAAATPLIVLIDQLEVFMSDVGKSWMATAGPLSETPQAAPRSSRSSSSN